MTWIEGLILGIIQGLAEFLPISSSGHLEIGKALLGVEVKESLSFTIVTHGATVLSTIVVFRRDILQIIRGLLKFEYNEELQFTLKILVSMIPIFILGVFFKDNIEALFDGNLLLVGASLIFTAALLSFTYFRKDNTRNISFLHAFLIGIAQSIAVVPGISRSGSTIATGLLLGNKKEDLARFSFLMVLIPILGENLLGIATGEFNQNDDISGLVLIIGAISAFVVGVLACKLMIRIVKQSKLIYFAIYCVVIGAITIVYSLS